LQGRPRASEEKSQSRKAQFRRKIGTEEEEMKQRSGTKAAQDKRGAETTGNGASNTVSNCDCAARGTCIGATGAVVSAPSLQHDADPHLAQPDSQHLRATCATVSVFADATGTACHARRNPSHSANMILANFTVTLIHNHTTSPYVNVNLFLAG
jgi:hypothetical protein